MTEPEHECRVGRSVAGFVICLDELGLDVTPILAGAGIIGLAVGFGAQNLVRDLISGFFLVLEDQVRVGDVAVVNGTGGLVEAITFRTIVLRDLAGVVHVVPNGAIMTLANMTKGWSGYVIDVGVAYKEDTDRVVDVMTVVAEDLRKDARFGPMILEPIEVFGVDDFKESEVTIKARLKTVPIQQWAVGREYRRRLKKAFDARGIEIPFPHRSLYVGTATGPLEVMLRQGSGTDNGVPVPAPTS
jgi:small conductance mechanosensitive channel